MLRTRALRLGVVVVAVGAGLVSPVAAADGPKEWADDYVAAVQEVNEAHAKRPGTAKEADLAARVPKDARARLAKVLAAPAGEETSAALEACAEAALDLDLVADFEAAKARLAKDDADRAARLGVVVSRPRFLLRGLNGLTEDYARGMADVVDAILKGYDELFGFDEWSKVPGKKLRFRVHREEKVTRPPHFAPQFPFHSEVDFPVLPGESFTSPSPTGQFFFYGLCHELGHVIAMWGDRDREEDFHTWAHYTGVLLVEHLTERKSPVVKDLKDVRWRSLEIERKEAAGKEPSTANAEGVMSLWIALHDEVGPKAIGDAIDLLDRKDERLRINRVRYYGLADLRKALLEVVKSKEKKKAVERIFA